MEDPTGGPLSRQFGKLGVALLAREIDRVLAVVRWQRWIGAVLQEQFGKRAVGVCTGFVHWAEARLLLRVWIRAGIEHSLHDFEVAACDRRV